MFIKKHLKFCLLLFYCILLCNQQFAQKKKEITTYSTDSINLHSPKKALLYSAMLPGGGQFYNKQYWKIPIVYGALGTTYYFVRWNNKKHKKYKNAYIDYKNFLEYKYQSPDQDPPIPLPENRSYEDLLITDVNDFNSTQEKWFQDILLDRQGDYKRDRDLLYIVLAGFYILNMFDALVSAHLLHFDVSENLSMNIVPYIEDNEMYNQRVMGISIDLNF